MKWHKDMTLKDEFPQVRKCGEEWRAITDSSERMKQLGQSRNYTQL